MAQVDKSQDRQSHVHVVDSMTDTDSAAVPAGAAEELESVRAENAALLTRVEDLEQLLDATAQEAEQRWADRQSEYEGLLEEKTEVIRSFHQKIGELREQLAVSGRPANSGAGTKTPTSDELLEQNRELEEQRRLMEEDKESMMAQLREMEMALARDRAELARQRAELVRMQNELKVEMDAAARSTGLRERLSSLQRHSESTILLPRPKVNQDTPPASPLPKAPAAPDSGGHAGKGGSGIFRRLFGSGQ